MIYHLRYYIAPDSYVRSIADDPDEMLLLSWASSLRENARATEGNAVEHRALS